MSMKNSFEALEELSRQMSFATRYGEIFRQFNNENYNRLTASFSQSTAMAIDTISEIRNRESNLLASMDIPSLNNPSAVQILNKKWETIASISEMYKTPEIIQLHNDLMRNNFCGLQTFVNSLNRMHIEAANLAFLKNNNVFELFSGSLPKGLKSIVKSIHTNTAKHLANSENISFDLGTKFFYIEDEPEEKASISETNILCSSLQLLGEIDEDELIKFMNHLYKFRSLALNHEVGKKIYSIVSNWNTTMNFDYEFYYHARELKEGDCPFTEYQLLQAPVGVTWHGRFNYVGESHYYFSNKTKGAILEVKKHSNEKCIQIAKLRPIREIKLIDLSQELTTQNKFLEYCRFSPRPQDYDKIKREYLIPCFFADCCKTFGIEGIKYYGSKEYSNYVSWHDRYFECVDFEVISN